MPDETDPHLDPRPVAGDQSSSGDSGDGGDDGGDGSPVVRAQEEFRPRVQTRPTMRLDPKELRASWPIVIAYLEQLAPWSVLALRLGTLALIQNCVRELAQSDARADLVVRLRELVEALAHMPLES
jgi:hypothetical protein